jgi:hypothetical protein
MSIKLQMLGGGPVRAGGLLPEGATPPSPAPRSAGGGIDFSFHMAGWGAMQIPSVPARPRGRPGPAPARGPSQEEEGLASMRFVQGGTAAPLGTPQRPGGVTLRLTFKSLFPIPSPRLLRRGSAPSLSLGVLGERLAEPLTSSRCPLVPSLHNLQRQTLAILLPYGGEP